MGSLPFLFPPSGGHSPPAGVTPLPLPSLWGSLPSRWGHSPPPGVTPLPLGSLPSPWGHSPPPGVTPLPLGSLPSPWGRSPPPGSLPYRTLAPSCQMCLFSATYDDDVIKFADQLIKEPNKIALKRAEETLDNIKQV